VIASRSLDRLYRPNDGRAAGGRRSPWLAVVTCMDPRVQPERALRVDPTDVYVLRNAGGRVTDDVVRSLVFAWSAREVDEFVVMHHADCGLLHSTDDELRRGVEEQLDVDASALEFAAFDDLDRSVVADVEVLRQSPLIPDDIPITGLVLDEVRLRVRTVVADQGSRL
jgi:carbonic anhydrase